jgi:hypothetical protein
MNIGLHPRILNYVLSIASVVRDPIHQSERRAGISLPQFLKGWAISSLGRGDKHFVGCSSGQEFHGGLVI